MSVYERLKTAFSSGNKQMVLAWAGALALIGVATATALGIAAAVNDAPPPGPQGVQGVQGPTGNVNATALVQNGPFRTHMDGMVRGILSGDGLTDSRLSAIEARLPGGKTGIGDAGLAVSKEDLDALIERVESLESELAQVQAAQHSHE